MPAGTAIFYPNRSTPLAQPGVTLFVERVTGEPLPNVRVISIENREFVPATASLRYALGDVDTLDAPSRVEDVFAVSANNPLGFRADDLIRIYRILPGGMKDYLFKGFVTSPQADLSGSSEHASFTATATPTRCFDRVLRGAIWRDYDGATLVDVNINQPPLIPQDIFSDLPVRANPPNSRDPVARGNCTPPGSDSGPLGFKSPRFLDPSHPSARLWDLAGLVKYCISTGFDAINDGQYLTITSLDALDDLFTTVEPTTEGGPIDLSDPTSFRRVPIPVSDSDLLGMTWPDAVRQLISPWGFAFKFQLQNGAAMSANGQLSEVPNYALQFYSRDRPTFRKTLPLQTVGQDLVPGRSVINRVSIARDTSSIVNSYYLASKPVRVEASFILAPGFIPDPNDLARPDTFVVGNVDFPTHEEMYRRFILDETGEGHFNLLTRAWETTIPQLAPVLQPNATLATPRDFIHRLRAPLRTLFTRGGDGKPLSARLDVSRDFIVPPGVWNPDLRSTIPGQAVGGTWSTCGAGHWDLLHDRIGITLTTKDIRSFLVAPHKQKHAGIADPIPGGTVNILASLAKPDTAMDTIGSVPNAPFTFRLTVGLELDHDLDVTSRRRPASPTKFEISRLDDVDDRFRVDVITEFSAVARDQQGGTGAGLPRAATDDSAQAQSHADQKRRSTELENLVGSFTIPKLTTAYAVGDAILGVQGRNINFALGAGLDRGETPQYPMISAIVHHFEGEQSTTGTFVYHPHQPAPERMTRND